MKGKTKKHLAIIMALFAALFILGSCGSSEPAEKVYLEDSEIDAALSDADSYKGKYVNIVGKEGLEIQVLSLFQRTVCHCYLAEVEMLRVNLTLCLCFLRERKGQAACSNDSSSFHVKQWLIFNC